jgi:hypothetical protein
MIPKLMAQWPTSLVGTHDRRGTEHLAVAALLRASDLDAPAKVLPHDSVRLGAVP